MKYNKVFKNCKAYLTVLEGKETACAVAVSSRRRAVGADAKEHCRETCGLCKPTPVPTPAPTPCADGKPGLAAIQDCSEYLHMRSDGEVVCDIARFSRRRMTGGDAKAHCRRTCGICVSHCFDKGPSIKSVKTCDNYHNLMQHGRSLCDIARTSRRRVTGADARENCAKTCGICKVEHLRAPEKYVCHKGFERSKDGLHCRLAHANAEPKNVISVKHTSSRVSSAMSGFGNRFTCPKEFVPGRPNGFLSAGGRHGCCVLDAAVNIAESLYLLHQCSFTFGLGKDGSRWETKESKWLKGVCLLVDAAPFIIDIEKRCCVGRNKRANEHCETLLSKFSMGLKAFQEQWTREVRGLYSACMVSKRKVAASKLGKRSAGYKQLLQGSKDKCENAELMLMSLVHFLHKTASQLYGKHSRDLTFETKSLLQATGSLGELIKYMDRRGGLEFDFDDEAHAQKEYSVNAKKLHSMKWASIMEAAVNRAYAQMHESFALKMACTRNQFAKKGCEAYWGAVPVWSEKQWHAYCNWYPLERECAKKAIGKHAVWGLR